MIRFIAFAATVVPATVLAETFQRPIPQPQSATAEFWFALASVGLVAALAAVHLLVRRR